MGELPYSTPCDNPHFLGRVRSWVHGRAIGILIFFQPIRKTYLGPKETYLRGFFFYGGGE